MSDLAECIREIVKAAARDGVRDALLEAGFVGAVASLEVRGGVPNRVEYSQAEAARRVNRSTEYMRIMRHLGLVESKMHGARVTIPASEVERLKRDGLPVISREQRLNWRRHARSAAAAAAAAAGAE